MTKVTGFNVTYEIWDYSDIDAGDTDKRGFVSKNVTFSEALYDVGQYAPEPSCSDVSAARWFSNDEYDIDIVTGETEQRSIHIPDNITDASRIRIAKLLGAKIEPRRVRWWPGD